MNKPIIDRNKISTIAETKYLNVYEYPFGENGHYYTATRRKMDNLVMIKSDDEYQKMIADAVTCVVILTNGEPKLLLNYEFRYATARYILAPPAGLIDPEDIENGNAVIEAAKREVLEETGIAFGNDDEAFIVSPLLFSSPGMTDESNAICCILINGENPSLNHNNSVGAEVFDGFELITKNQALDLLKDGKDKFGNYFSVYTWAALMYFVSDMWK